MLGVRIFASPTLLVDAGDFRGVYMDLHAAGTAGTRIFVQDIGPDGLISRNDNADSWEEAGKTVTFDGQWKKGKSSEAEYDRAFADADERYAKMLSLLVTQLKQLKAKPGSSPRCAPPPRCRGTVACARLRTSSVGRLAQW